MSLEKSLIIIKPDSVKKHNVGAILSIFEKNNFKILRVQSVIFSNELAKEFYNEHVGKAFFQELSDFITSGMSIVVVFEKENCILDARELIGATNPKDAKEGTIRALFADSIDSNAIHGSDSVVSANREIGIFFKDLV